MIIVPPALTVYKTPFDPLTLFSGIAGDWFLASDLGTLWTDTTATTPATVGTAIARWDSKSGSGRYITCTNAAQRPTLLQDGSGYYYLEFSGSGGNGDVLYSPAGTRTYTVGAGSFIGVCYFPTTLVTTMTIVGVRQDDAGLGIANYHTLNSNSGNSGRVRGVVEGGPNSAAEATANSATGSSPAATPIVATSVLSATTVDISVNGSALVTAATTFGATNFASQCGYSMNVFRMALTGGNAGPVNLYGALTAASITNQNRANAQRYLGALAGLRI